MNLPSKRFGFLCLHFALVLFGVSSLRAAVPDPVSEGHEHNIVAAQVMNRTLLAVMEQYYDPARMDPGAMFRGGLDALVKNVAELQVSWSQDKKAVTLHLLQGRITLSADQIKSPWSLSRAFQQIFAFIREHLPTVDQPDYRSIEYAATNGMLSTLDPHTNAMLPELWNEMQMNTQGEFEGIGIRITTDKRAPCSGELTVVEVFNNTPAFHAGLKTGDKIIQIDGDSTVNITTDAAAKRLRGKRGTTVNVRIKRPDGSQRDVPIIRQTIPIDSVKWRMLAGQVGYVELVGFQPSSAEEMRDALRALHKQNMKGLILDLRSNPGGLLNAAIDIADLFVSSGTIVTTAGRQREDREVSNAKFADTEPAYPLVVLIDTYSASAAEIVAGAVRNHGRALLVGERSFGKGSVQTIMPLPGEGALRLTVQQYLTPGDISIQAVGVVPDIRLSSYAVNRDALQISSRERSYSEETLAAHLTSPSPLATQRVSRQTSHELPYLIPEKERRLELAEARKCTLEGDERATFRSRYEVEFARELITMTQGATTAELLIDAQRLIASRIAAHDKDLQNAFRRIGINWTSANAPQDAAATITPSADLQAEIAVVGQSDARQDFRLRVTVTNRGTTAVHRLRGKTKSDNPLLSEIDLAFGRIAPGASQKWEAPITVFPLTSTRVDPVTVHFESDEGIAPAPVSIDVRVQERTPPVLSYAWYLEDLGNGNGHLEPAETFRMHVIVRNDGAGPTFASAANLSANAGIDVEHGHFDIGVLAPGKSAQGTFSFRVHPEFPHAQNNVRFVVEEWVPFKTLLNIALLDQELVLPISALKPAPEAASGTVTISGEQDVWLFETPDAHGRRVAKAAPGAAFAVDKRMGDFFRVVLGKGRTAWVSEKRVVPGGKAQQQHVPVLSMLPDIRIDAAVPNAVSSERIRISGVAHHIAGVRDVLVFVNSEKVLYQLAESNAPTLAFSAELPLKAGMNQVQIIARHDERTFDSRVLSIRRTDKSAAAPTTATTATNDDGANANANAKANAASSAAP